MAGVPRSTGTAPEQPGLIWGGEGGSYVLGHNFLTQTIVDLARSGDRAALFEELTVSNRWYPQWQRLLRRGWSEQVRVQVEHRFRSEMCHTAPDDPGRAPYFFLLLNEQRRHLDDLQANADLIRAYTLTPFL